MRKADFKTMLMEKLEQIITEESPKSLKRNPGDANYKYLRTAAFPKL